METRVKISHLTQELKTLSRNFGWQSFASYIFACETISFHNIALFLFDYKIWLYDWKQVIQHWSSCLPIVNGPSEFFLTSPSISGIFRTTKSIFNPYYEFFIAASDFKHAMPLKAIAILSLFNSANIQTAFSINNACKISDLPNLMTCIEFNYFSHEIPFVYNTIILNEYKIHGERLSEKALFRDAIV